MKDFDITDIFKRDTRLNHQCDIDEETKQKGFCLIDATNKIEPLIEGVLEKIQGLVPARSTNVRLDAMQVLMAALTVLATEANVGPETLAREVRACAIGRLHLEAEANPELKKAVEEMEALADQLTAALTGKQNLATIPAEQLPVC